MRKSKASKPRSSSGELMGQRVTEEVRTLILSGELQAGSRIGQEELARRVGTSRIPVREALRRLENDGLIVLVPNSGARVAKVDLAECVEIYKMRERLEPLAMSESVAHLTDKQIDALELLLERIEKSTRVEDFLRLDREFHISSYEAAGLPRLIGTVERFWNSTQHYRRAFLNLFGGMPDKATHYEHNLLIAAIRRRDQTEAEHIVFSHIRRTRVALEQRAAMFDPDKNIDHRSARPRKRRSL